MSLTSVKSRQLLALPQVYADIDLRTVEHATLEAKRLFQVTKPGTLHGLAGWFEAQLCEGVTIDTSPSAAPTHWRQALFPFRAAVEVIRGDYLEVSLRVQPEAERSDNTTITYDYRCTQLAKEAQDPPAAPRPIRATPKPARNAPCPCGSGRKYKRCCGSAG